MSAEISSAIRAAQAALVQKRAQMGVRPKPQTIILPTSLPDHLGWGNHRLLANSIKTIRPKSAHLTALRERTPSPQSQTKHIEPVRPEREIVVFPDLALEILQREMAAPGRIWHLLRYLDSTGSGWLTIEEAKHALAEKASPTRVVGWRQLRKLFAVGQDVFWRRDKTRVWLFAPWRVAKNLGVMRLKYRPITCPLTRFLGSIGEVRAALYGTFHSGRADKPIARVTVQRHTSIAPSTQRNYENRLGMTPKTNYALLNEDKREAMWRHGAGVFQLTDEQGRFGRPNTIHTVRQLPNSYEAVFQPCTKTKQKRANKRLFDLRTKGIAGNEQRKNRRYFRHGGELARGCGDGYLPSQHNGFWFAVGSGCTS